ncbi:MAG: cupin domain-containing protein, partial [Oscillospiraceae bacterium]|nr:cupin domain-containing protein [Oscillospiraceae bacterium]
MTVGNATNTLMDVALRIRELREIMGYSTAQMAERTGISEEQYLEYEKGAEDLPFTFLHKCALALGVELIQLLEGHSAKLSNYTVTRRGMGLVTAIEDGIMIQDMAALFRQKIATPYYVTYQYSEELQDQPIHTTTHGGQEFDMVIRGSLKVQVGDHTEILREGDSIFYDSSTPHGMIAIDGEDCVFLAMIMAAEEVEEKTDVEVREHKDEEESLLCSRYIQATEDENHRLTDIRFTDADTFNFAFDIVDEIGRRDPDKLAMVHVSND